MKVVMKKPSGVLKKPAASGAGSSSVIDDMKDVEDQLTNMSAESQKEIRAKRRVLDLAVSATKAGTGGGDELPAHVMDMITNAVEDGWQKRRYAKDSSSNR